VITDKVLQKDEEAYRNISLKIQKEIELESFN
jgi:hypothetical protein